VPAVTDHRAVRRRKILLGQNMGGEYRLVVVPARRPEP
jgi:hypothetical protein